MPAAPTPAPDLDAPFGMISGNGIYPETFARAARAAGAKKLAAAAFHGETEPRLADLVEAIGWFRVEYSWQNDPLFKGEGVTQAVMVGQIAPRNLFDLRPDFRTLALLARLKERNAESIFARSLANW
ncbi:MAG: hypothetical protein R3F11_21680 [Verrucomicrobiales bacterium]